MTGTFVNGRRIEGSVEIDSGAMVQIADRRYRLSQDKQALVPIETKDDSIEAVNVEVSTGNGKRQKTLIHDVSFVIQPGELVAVMGPSGAGKSTLLSIVNGQAVPSRGQVIIGGLDLHDHLKFSVEELDLCHRMIFCTPILLSGRHFGMQPDYGFQQIRRMMRSKHE